jgi:uncharacterized membrane protein
MLVDTTAYKVLFLLHITSIVVAFGPAVVQSALARQYVQDGPAAVQRFHSYAARNGQRINGIALVLAGLFGILLIVTSEDLFKFDQTWINLAFLVWIAMNGVLHGMILPAEKKLAAGDSSAGGRLQAGEAIISLLFVVMLYVMIWKPGF